MRRALGMALATGSAVLVLAGCGGAGGSSTPEPTGTAVAVAGAGGVQQVTVHGTDDLMFAPATLAAKVGMLQVTFVNDGSIAHTFRIKGIEPHITNVNGHNRATVTVDLTKPGDYTIECDYHPDMVGVLVVTQ